MRCVTGTAAKIDGVDSIIAKFMNKNYVTINLLVKCKKSFITTPISVQKAKAAKVILKMSGNVTMQHKVRQASVMTRNKVAIMTAVSCNDWGTNTHVITSIDTTQIDMCDEISTGNIYDSRVQLWFEQNEIILLQYCNGS